jgi:hypothetical protein
VPIEVAIGDHGDQLAAGGQPVERLAQVLAGHALDAAGGGHDAVQAAVLGSHLTAVFGPTLSTPGTLSTVSPISVR